MGKDTTTYNVANMLSHDKSNVATKSDSYNSFFGKDHSEGKENKGSRETQYTTMINHYYDLVTDFYEYGWGESFHFAPRFLGESFDASLARHEHWLSHQMGLRPGLKVLDVGCGVGGPMRAIARHSGAHITGINNNEYQIERGIKLNEKCGLAELTDMKKGDFHHMPFEDESFDMVYGIEATCHSPDRKQLFSEISRILKPGGTFACYEWVMTPKYDPDNSVHNEVKHGIEAGDSLPDLTSAKVVTDALEYAGFKLEECRDLALKSNTGNDVPWYASLEGSYSVQGFRRTPLGRWITLKSLQGLEKVRIVPKGSSSVAQMLNGGADNLVKGGQMEIFTPMLWCKATKPAKK